MQSLKVKMRYINFYRGEIRTYMACGGYVMRQDKKSIAFTEVDIDFRDMRSGYITKHSIKWKIFHNYLIISNHSRYL